MLVITGLSSLDLFSVHIPVPGWHSMSPEYCSTPLHPPLSPPTGIQLHRGLYPHSAPQMSHCPSRVCVTFSTRPLAVIWMDWPLFDKPHLNYNFLSLWVGGGIETAHCTAVYSSPELKTVWLWGRATDWTNLQSQFALDSENWKWARLDGAHF